MKKISNLIVFITFSLFSFETYAAKIKVQSVSENPIFAFTNPNAKINVIDEKSVDLLLEIKRGEKTKISSIKFIGNDCISER